MQASGGLSKSQKKKAKAKAAAARKQAAAENGKGSIEQNGSANAGPEGPVGSTATAGEAYLLQTMLPAVPTSCWHRLLGQLIRVQQLAVFFRR